MNKTKLIISILTTIWWILPFISFSANEQPTVCTTCWNSPANLNLINNFTTEILSNIKTIGTEGSYAGKHVPPSWFDSGKFVAPKQSIVSKALRRARESLWSVLSIKRIHLELSDLANLWDSLGVLAGNKTILRDRQKMNKIEQDINRKKYELSVGWWRTDTIAWVPQQKINAIIKRYQDLWILSKSSKISIWSEYWDLILLIWRVNSSLKHLISLGGTGWAEAEKKISFDLRTSGKIAIKIESKAIEQIKTDYNCTRRYACEQSRWNIKDQMKAIKEALKSWVGNARKQIGIANSNLKKAYSLENIKKTFTEQTMFNQLSGALNDFKNWRKKNNDSTTTDTETTTWTTQQPIINQQDTLANSIATTNDKEKIKNDFKTKMQSTQKIIQDDANAMMKKYATTDVTDIMAYFVIISQKMNGIINNTIGNKDLENCLIKNLGALCEKQCSNIGNKSCYY